MTTYKKDKIFRIIFLLIIIILILVRINMLYAEKNAEKWAEQRRILRRLYYDQNEAFELSRECENPYQYHGIDDLNLNVLVIDLHTFNSMQKEYQLTIDEIRDYLSKKRDSHGKLRIYSPPENIAYYISWYTKRLYDFRWEKDFNNYLKAHGYKSDSYRDMNYEEVVDALEEYQNDPSYVPPGQQKD